MEHTFSPTTFSFHSPRGWTAHAFERTMALGALVLAAAAVLCWHHPIALAGLPVLLWAMHRTGLLAWITESAGYQDWILDRVGKAVVARSEEALRQAVIHPAWDAFTDRLGALAKAPASSNPYSTGPGVQGPDGRARIGVFWDWTRSGLVAYPLPSDDWWAQDQEHGLCINTLMHTPVVVSWKDPALLPLVFALSLIARIEGNSTIVASALLDADASSHRRLALRSWAMAKTKA